MKNKKLNNRAKFDFEIHSVDGMKQTSGVDGLTEQEAQNRLRQGYANNDYKHAPKSISKIIAEHVFTPFNMLNLCLFLVIVYVSFSNMKYLLNGLFFGVAIVNTIGGIIQEMNARKAVKRLSIINQMNVQVIREGQKKEISIENIVLGDLLSLRYEDQIPVDAKFIEGTNFLVDESLLTGEQQPISKQEGDYLYSGSFVTSGHATAIVTKVGQDTYASQITKEAHIIRKPNSEIRNALDKVSKYLGILILIIGIAMISTKMIHPNRDSIEDILTSTVAALVGMIPEGLVLLNSAAFFIGVIALSKHNILVQRASTIETLARIDTLCLDKTGTITTGGMQVERINWIKHHLTRENCIYQGLQVLDDENKTAIAVMDFLEENVQKDDNKLKVEHSYSFSSERKWSGVFFEKNGLWLFGAPEILISEIMRDKYANYIEEKTKSGIRLLAVVHSSNDLIEEQIFPEELHLQCFIEISDTIREKAKETFDYFHQEDVNLKIISGDNPITVQAIAAKANISNLGKTVDMSLCEEPINYNELVNQYQFFGRVTPFQKKEIISALQKNKHVVGMTGDGVNDVPAMKVADCSIAMAAGSNAAKVSSDLMLLNNDLSEMIPTVYEGRRIINNVERTAVLFLTKTVFTVLLSILFLFMNYRFPLFPIQMTLISSGTIGMPGFFLALLPNQNRVEGRFLPKTLRTSFPAGLAASIAIYIQYLTMQHFGIAENDASTISLCILLSVSLLVLGKTCLPFTRYTFPIFLASCLIVVIAFMLFPNIFFIEQLSQATIRYTMIYCFIAVSMTILLWMISAKIYKKIYD